MKKLIAFMLLAWPCFATTTVSGHLANLGTGSVTSSAFVRFWLRGCAGNQPRITGTALIAPSQGGVFYFDMAADSSGKVSGTIYSTRDAAGTGNGDIECGGSYTSVWYGMQIYNNGVPGPEVAIHAKSGTTLDPSSVTPISTTPATTAPTGDSTYMRLDGGNSPATGGISFTGIGSHNLYQYFNKTDNSGTVVNRTQSNNIGANFDTSFLSLRQITAGGQYGGTQPAYFGFLSNMLSLTQGQFIGFQSIHTCLGIGNCSFAGGVAKSWGGGDASLVSPGSTPMIGVGEFNSYVGDPTPSASVFSATVTAVNGTTVTYGTPTNNDKLGERFVLDSSRTYNTGTVSCASNTCTGSGTSWTSGMVGMYIAVGESQYAYAAPCVNSLTANINSVCYPILYKIAALDVGGQVITLGTYYGTNEPSGAGQSYVIVNGAQATAVDQNLRNITVDNATSLGAQVGDTIVSPPSPWVVMGQQNIFYNPYGIDRGSVNAGIAGYNNKGNIIDVIHFYQGPYRHIDVLEGTVTGLQVAYDMHAADASYAAVWMNFSNGTSNRLCWGGTCQAYIYASSQSNKYVTAIQNGPHEFSDTGNDWDFAIERGGAAGIAALADGSNNDYGNGANGQWMRQTQGTNGTIALNPGTGGLVVGQKIVVPKISGITDTGTVANLHAANSDALGGVAAVSYLRYVGTITTTASASDNLSVTGLTASGHCSFSATNSTAAGLTGVFGAAGSGAYTLNHSASSGGTFDIFCAVQ